MGKYSQAYKDILSIFGTEAWTLENVKSYPASLVPDNPGKEYIRISIIPSENGINVKSTSGMMIIDIFTQRVDGPMPSASIADKLDAHLQHKTVALSANSSTQFLGSSLTSTNQDKANPLLNVASYSIPFNYFGVL